MEFKNFPCRICSGKLMPKLNELVCDNCGFIEHPPKETNFLISCQEVKKKIDNKENIIILDVREKWEYSTVKINNSISILMRELKNKINELDKNKQIIVVCHRGNRASYTTRYLIQNSFNAKCLEGGIDAWAAKIDNSMKRY